MKPENGKALFWSCLCAFALAFCGGCQKAGSKVSPLKRQGSEPIDVVCTTGMVADLVKHVGGKHVKVTQMMGEGVDPHLYKASPGDVSAMESAEMIFYSGLHLEGNLVSSFESLAKSKPVYAVTDEIQRWFHDRLLKGDGDTHDPHVWFDVSLWQKTLRLIADRLADYDPAHASEYVANAKSYSEKLSALHKECLAKIEEIPKERRVLVTAHDAFHYFGKAYGIEVRAVQGVSTEAEAGVKQVEELVSFLVERKIRAVFAESSVSDDNIKQLIEGCQAQGHELSLGGKLFSDAMGKPGTPEGTYEGMIRHNLDVIVKALR
ncbi:MAG: manganese ABC transporter substrate-binding protein/adhesin MntA [Planctomycetaceae bacterium]